MQVPPSAVRQRGWAARLPAAASAGRHSADKQQKNAILNDAGGFPTLELIEVRVYKRHGEDN